MANTYSALKRMRQTKRKTMVNRLRKSRLRHQIRSMRRLIEHKDAKGAEDSAAGNLFADRSLGSLGHHQEEHGGALQEPAAGQVEGDRVGPLPSVAVSQAQHQFFHHNPVVGTSVPQRFVGPEDLFDGAP